MLFRCTLLCRATFTLYHTFYLLSTPFLKFFQKSFLTSDFLVLSNALSQISLSIISYQLSFVKTFLCELFMKFLLSYSLGLYCSPEPFTFVSLLPLSRSLEATCLFYHFYTRLSSVLYRFYVFYRYFHYFAQKQYKTHTILTIRRTSNIFLTLRRNKLPRH